MYKAALAKQRKLFDECLAEQAKHSTEELEQSESLAEVRVRLANISYLYCRLYFVRRLLNKKIRTIELMRVPTFVHPSGDGARDATRC